jgi:hypothetical protein
MVKSNAARLDAVFHALPFMMYLAAEVAGEMEVRCTGFDTSRYSGGTCARVSHK